MSAPTTVVDGLHIEHGPGVLTPRPWTAMQGHWAADLLHSLPPGPVLELCCGVGHIGLVATRESGRRLVQVDVDELACSFAVRNARSNGRAGRVEVRHGPLLTAVRHGERFALVIADPPYVPSHLVAEFPDDPSTAIDGGPDGLDIARDCLTVAHHCLAEHGAVLMQLRDREQAETLAVTSDVLQLVECRSDSPQRAIAQYRSVGGISRLHQSVAGG